MPSDAGSPTRHADSTDASSWLGVRWARSWLAGLVLVVLCAALYVPGLASIPAVDRDESRFAQASRQMLESGTLEGWVVPRVGETPRLNKPPVIYWLQAGSVWVLSGGHPARDAIWMYRVPSLIAATITVLVTWRLGCQMFDPRAGWLGAAMLAVSPMVVWDAHQARSDQLLLATTTISMALLWRCWRARREGGPRLGMVLALWVMVGVGVMSKGPITPMVVMLAAAALALTTRGWRWLWRLNPLVGVVMIVVVALPWVMLVAREIGWSEYWSIIRDETVGRSVDAAEGHWGPPGYHLVLLPVLLWPGSLLTAAGVVRAWKRGAVRAAMRAKRVINGRDAELFCLCWVIPAWIVFEAVSTKLPHYTMVLYPPIALLSARSVLSWRVAVSALRGVGGAIGTAIWGVIGCGFVIGSVVLVVVGRERGWMSGDELSRMPGMNGVPMIATAVLLVVGVTALAGAMALAVKKRALWAMLCAGAASVVTIIALMDLIVPRLTIAWVTPRVQAVLQHADPDGKRAIALVGYQEDSLVFGTRGRAERVGRKGASAWLNEHPTGIMVAPASGRANDPGVHVLARVSGFNYSNGEHVDLEVFERVPQ